MPGPRFSAAFFMHVLESGLLATEQHLIDMSMTSASLNTCTMHVIGGLWHG